MINVLLVQQKGPGIMTAINYSQKQSLSISDDNFILHVKIYTFSF